MNRTPHGRSHPGLGATWYPGAQDDFCMPEVISPSPQRVMPEVPENMQDNIAYLEHEARDPRRSQQASVQYANYPERTSSATQFAQAQNQGYDESSYTESDYGSGSYERGGITGTMDQPSISPFPVLRDPPPNVPPTSEQREMSLENARIAVLSSNDPEMQLSWAQDALAYVEVAIQNEARLSLVRPPRPQTPRVEHQLKADAMSVVNFLADQHHPKADFIKGTWLEFGKFGFQVDKREAFRAYVRAAEKGYARAEYRIGMQFESSGEPAKAIRHYEKGVSLADSASYYRLGMMILLGQHGYWQDYQTGLEYIRIAAESCDENAPQGAYIYGMLLARELPQVSVPDTYLPLDVNAARINVEKAAYHGFAKAQVKMGAAYELCQLGCDFNPALSLHYNTLAARQGEPEAEMAISKWFLCGHEGVFEKNDELAFTYAQRAAQSGFPTAEFALGYFYEVGLFVPVDIKEARSWYAKAAASGNKDATNRIDSISRSKTLSRKDHENVAIARIKSRYGSHRRGPNSHTSVPESVEMPDPSKMSISDDNGTPPAPAAPAVPTAPAPPTALPVPVTPPAAPYPDRPASRTRPGYAPGHPLTDPRPSSAFGINPNIRPDATGYGLPPQQTNRAASYGPGPIGNQPISGGALGPGPGPGPRSSSVMAAPAPAPRVDIGYSAPLEPSGVDRMRHASAERQPARRPGPLHPQNNRINSPRPTASPTTPTFPPRVESASTASKPSIQPQTQGSQKPTGQPPSKQPGPYGLPGKGPKTFEEMGVPLAKNESDCIMM